MVKYTIMYFSLNFLALFLFFFSEYAVTAVLPLYITEYLSMDEFYSGLFTGIFSISAMTAKFASGALADGFGKLKVYKSALLFTALTVFLYSKVAGIIAVSLVILLHGGASGVVRGLFMSVTASIVSKKYLSTAIGIMGVAMTLSMMISSAGSVLFVKSYSYISFFNLLAVLYIAAATIMFLFKLPETKISVPFKMGSFIEKKVIPFALFRFCGAMCYGLFLSYAVLHAKKTGGINPGLVITAYAAANIILRPLTGFIIDRINVDTKYFLILPYIVLMAGYYMFAVSGADYILVSAFIIGVGAGMEYTIIGSSALKSVGELSLNRASSTIELFFSIGIAVSSISSGLFLHAGLSTVFTVASLVNIIPVTALIIFYVKKTGLR